MNNAATRDTDGAISCISSNHLPLSEPSMSMKPVVFPPGFARVATKPLPIGSDTDANTIGIVSARQAPECCSPL